MTTVIAGSILISTVALAGPDGVFIWNRKPVYGVVLWWQDRLCGTLNEIVQPPKMWRHGLECVADPCGLVHRNDRAGAEQ